MSPSVTLENAKVAWVNASVLGRHGRAKKGFQGDDGFVRGGKGVNVIVLGRDECSFRVEHVDIVGDTMFEGFLGGVKG